MSHEDFSATDDPEQDTFNCKLDILPILPVRFALLPSKTDPIDKPTSIDSTGSYLVRRLRRGFVYIFVEAPEDEDGSTSEDGVWQVFRYSTDAGDINSDLVPEDTEIRDNGSYAFSKYMWKGHYGRGGWEYTGETENYCWVPKSASTIWMAYSEYRWPPSFFENAHDEGFRTKIMQKINLRGDNEWAAYVDEISNIVEEYKPAGSQPEDVLEECKISQTVFEPARRAPVLPSTAECVDLVALFDPMGDVKELHHRLAIQDHIQRAYTAENMYPIATGQVSKGIMDSVKREGYKAWFNDPALQEGWEETFDEIIEKQECNKEQVKFVCDAIIELVADDADCAIGTHLELAGIEAEKCEDDIWDHEYYSVMFGRTLQAFSFTAYGMSLIEAGVKETTPTSLGDRGGAVIHKALNTFRKCWSGNREFFYKSIRNRAYAFDVVFKEISVSLGANMSAGNIKIESWKDAISAGYSKQGTLDFSTKRMSLYEVDKLILDHPKGQRTIFVDGTVEAFGPGGRKLKYDPNSPGDQSGKKIRAMKKVRSQMNIQHMMTGIETDVPFILREYKISTTPDKLAAHHKIQMYERGYAALGTMLAVWAVANAFYAEEAAPDRIFKKTEFTGFIQSRDAQKVAAAAWALDAGAGLFVANKYMPTSSAVIGRKGMDLIFKRAIAKLGTRFGLNRNAFFANIELGYGQSAKAVTGRMLATGLGYLSVGLGTIVAAAAVQRGAERHDRAEVIGNIAMLIGGLMFIPGLGVAALIIGAALIVVGWIITYFSYGQIEDVVRTSFWGSTPPYWGSNVRLDLDTQIQASKKITGKTALDRTVSIPVESAWYDFINDDDDIPNATGDVLTYFKEEMDRLMELFWFPEIIPGERGSHSFIVRTPALAKGATANVTVKVENTKITVVPFPPMHSDGLDVYVTQLNLQKSYSSKTSEMTVTFDAGYDEIDIEVIVTGVSTQLNFTNTLNVRNP